MMAKPIIEFLNWLMSELTVTKSAAAMKMTGVTG